MVERTGRQRETKFEKLAEVGRKERLKRKVQICYSLKKLILLKTYRQFQKERSMTMAI